MGNSAFNKALMMLQVRNYSEFELRQKLLKKEYSQEDTQDAIELLKSYQYINDRVFSDSYIRTRINTISKRRISMALNQKGIDHDTINDALQAAEDSDPEAGELTAIKKAATNYLRKKPVTNREEQQKLLGFLYRKGFEMGNIRKVLNSIQNTEIDYEESL